ncbi:apolipoprotein L2-like [Salarias fasciatus]|uniref:Apolipoprotein L2-like n=1 Tax=Salarias fasciatus TaxID=181472 RepID=A0A672HMD2_SALFA|nr:apolipoprotein L2-like [Salarias fasciatus]
MSANSEDLQVALLEYTKDTLTYIHTVRTFCEMSSKWKQFRETEVEMLKDIKDRAEKLEPNLRDVTQSENKGKAFQQYMKKTFNSSFVDRQRTELEGELTELLKDVLQVLKEISSFLEAVEKLASTSLEVFTENKLLHLPRDVTLNHFQVVVLAANAICPLVLDFKIDMDPFFLPRLQNVEVLAHQLEKYIQTISNICEKFGKSCFSDFDLETVGETVVDLSARLPEEDIQRMLDHINQLAEIRNDPHFRMAFLFKQVSAEHFVTEFKNRQPRMLTFLKDLEDTAVKLDRMNKGARISTVAGSSVGAVGGVLSIVGLALIPFTAGVSLSLTLAGVGLGITSGVNSIVTTATEMGVNKTQEKKANNSFQNFMEDVQRIQDCVDEAKCLTDSEVTANTGEMNVEVNSEVGAGGMGIDVVVDTACAINVLKSEQAAAGAGRVLAQEGKALSSIPRVASDIPDLGQAAAKTSVAVTKTARAGFITLNALFLGMDVFMIYKTSKNLAKGSETQVSKFIRARAALWSSVMDSWQKMFDSLVQGLETLKEKEAVLESPFYPRLR